MQENTVISNYVPQMWSEKTRFSLLLSGIDHQNYIISFGYHSLRLQTTFNYQYILNERVIHRLIVVYRFISVFALGNTAHDLG